MAPDEVNNISSTEESLGVGLQKLALEDKGFTGIPLIPSDAELLALCDDHKAKGFAKFRFTGEDIAEIVNTARYYVGK